MTRIFALLASTAIVVGQSAYAQETTTQTPAETETPVAEVEMIDATADTVMATVNGSDITLGQLILIRTALPPEYQNLEDKVLMEGILDQIIQQAAVAKEPEGGLPLSVELALQNERRSILAGRTLEAVAEAAVTDEALQAAYDAAYGNVEPEPEFNASHILVETEEEANALVEALNGGADFAELAKEKSTGPSGPGGGVLGWFGKGAMVPAFEAAVLELEVGAVSAPVQTQFGWHVVKLNEKREKPAPTIEDVRGELAGPIQEKAVQDYVTAQSAAADVTRIDLNTIDPAAISNRALLGE